MTKTPRRNPRWRDLSWKDKAAEAAQQLMEAACNDRRQARRTTSPDLTRPK